MRLRRLELPPDVTGPVYQRMESERRRVANELRSLGAAESEKIRADADRQRQVILAEAYAKRRRSRARATRRRRRSTRPHTGQNPEFYAFYRSLEAYKATFRSRNDMMVLDPSARVLPVLQQSGGGAHASARAAEVAERAVADEAAWRTRCGRRSPCVLILEGAPAVRARRGCGARRSASSSSCPTASSASSG